MRRILIVVGAAFLIAGVLLGYAVLNLNRIIGENKAYALAEISDALGRKVEIRDVKASLRWGVIVDVTGVKIADDPAFSPSPIIEVSEVYGEAELMPLLAGHLSLRRLVFKEPQVRIVRDAGGKLNLNEIGKNPEPGAPTPEKLGENKPADQGGPASGTSTSIAQGEATPGALERFAIKAVSIRNGTLSYNDLGAGGEPLAVTAIDLDLTRFSAIRRFDIIGKMAALDSDQNVTFSGQVGPLVSDGKLDAGAVPIDLEATVDPIVLERLRRVELLARSIPLPLAISDIFQVKARITGVADSLKFELNSDLSGPRVIYTGLLDKPADVPLRISIDGSRDHGAVAVDSVKLTIAALELKVGSPEIGQGVVQARLDSNRFDLGSVVKTIPAAAVYSVAGDAEIHADIKVELPQLVLVPLPGGGKPGAQRMGMKVLGPHLEGQGTVGLSRVTIGLEGGIAPPVANLTGNLRLTGKGAVIEPASFDLGSGHAKLQAEIDSFDPLKGKFSFSDDLVKLAEIVPSRKSDHTEDLHQLSASGTLGGTLAAPELNSDATSAAGTISNVEYHDLALAASYADDRIDIRSLKFNAFGGAIAGSAAATITKARPFEAKLSLDNIDLEKLLASQKAKAAGTVRGSLTGQIQIAGSGIRLEQIKPTLRGGGKAVIQNGKLVGVNIAAQTIKKTKKIPGMGDLVSPEIIARHPELFASPDTDIRQASLSFTIEGPRIISHDIAIQSPDYKILGDGSFDADKNIDLKAKLVIAKELSGELEANKKAVAILANKNGEIEIPVQIVGTLPKPNVLPDIQAIVETAAHGAFKQKVGKLLDKLFH
jgi:hypothetical protein